MTTKAENAKTIQDATGIQLDPESRALSAEKLQNWANDIGEGRTAAVRTDILLHQLEQQYGAVPPHTVADAVLQEWLSRPESEKDATVAEIKGPDPEAADTVTVVCTRGIFVDAGQQPGRQIVRDEPVTLQNTLAVAQALASGLLKKAGA